MNYTICLLSNGKEKAKNLVSFVEAKVEEGLKHKTNIFAIKEDVAKLRLDIQIQINKVLIGLIAQSFFQRGIIIGVIKLLQVIFLERV